jgi:hypothetical protein
MRWCRTTSSRYLAWLGVVALACNAAIPVVLAFLLSAALAAPQPEWVQLADGQWRFVGGEFCRHHDDGGGSAGQHGKPSGVPCPVCSLHGALAVALSAPTAAPAGPTTVAAVIEPLALTGVSVGIVRFGYRSRAPPIA